MFYAQSRLLCGEGCGEGSLGTGLQGLKRLHSPSSHSLGISGAGRASAGQLPCRRPMPPTCLLLRWPGGGGLWLLRRSCRGGAGAPLWRLSSCHFFPGENCIFPPGGFANCKPLQGLPHNHIQQVVGHQPGCCPQWTGVGQPPTLRLEPPTEWAVTAPGVRSGAAASESGPPNVPGPAQTPAVSLHLASTDGYFLGPDRAPGGCAMRAGPHAMPVSPRTVRPFGAGPASHRLLRWGPDGGRGSSSHALEMELGFSEPQSSHLKDGGRLQATRPPGCG